MKESALIWLTATLDDFDEDVAWLDGTTTACLVVVIERGLFCIAGDLNDFVPPACPATFSLGTTPFHVE